MNHVAPTRRLHQFSPFYKGFSAACDASHKFYINQPGVKIKAASRAIVAQPRILYVAI